MRTMLALVLAAAFGLGSASTCWADRWMAPRPSIHAAPGEEYGFKLIPPDPRKVGEERRGARGVLFTLNADGSERVVWDRELPNVPLRVLMTPDNKALVTLNTHHRVGDEHSVVLYDGKGDVVKAFALEDLLTKEEIERHVRRTVSSRWWTDDADVHLRPEWGRLVIRFKWGKNLNIDLATGKFEDPADMRE